MNTEPLYYLFTIILKYALVCGFPAKYEMQIPYNIFIKLCVTHV